MRPGGIVQVSSDKGSFLVVKRGRVRDYFHL